MNRTEFLVQEMIKNMKYPNITPINAYLKAVKKYEKIEGKKICFYIKPIILINIEL